MIKTALLAAALLGVSITPASGQTQLQPNQPAQGRVEQNAYACFLLITTAGSQWRVDLTGSMDTYLEIGRGSCATMTVDSANDDVGGLFGGLNSRIDFASGGGAYTVRVWGLGGAAGNYAVTARPRAGLATSGRLPAASAAGPWLNPGWTPDSVSAAPARSGEGLAPGNVFKDCADVCPEMVVIPAGGFTMGSPAEEAGRTAAEGPRHPVALVHAFAVGRYEVTFAEYDACVADGACSHRPNDQGWGRGRRPVVDVSWNDAQAYVEWLGGKTGQRYALLSEAEWEYVARAGSNDPWQTGKAILTDDANILNQFARTVNVGGYPPNAFGLHDVHGNVAEWTLDCLDTGYIGVPNDGSAATGGNCAAARLIRGGAFSSEPGSVRFAARAAAAQDARFTGQGFRVARAL